MDYKLVVGIVAIIIGFIGYAPYLRDLFVRKTTKPHFFSWFLWAVLESIAFIASLKEGGGPGAWVLGFSVMVAIIIAVKALTLGDKNITRLDWIGFIGAIVGIALWPLTKSPATAVVVVTITDMCAFIPTYRKGFQYPHEETIEEFGASSLKQALSLVALRSYNVSTVLYPASLVVTNGVFTVMVYLRRRHLRRKQYSNS